MSRRSFLHKGSLAVGAAGAAAALPSIGKVAERAGTLPAAGRVAPVAASEAALPAKAPAAHGPIVAHVRDVGSGRIDVFVGRKRIEVRDRATAAALYRLAH